MSANKPLTDIKELERLQALRRYLDLSTAHMTDADQQLLTRHCAAGENHLKLGNSMTRIVAHDYGWWVLVPPQDDASKATLCKQIMEGTRQAGLSTAFGKLFIYALELGCSWINFDRDADELEGLESFEW